MPGLFHEVQQRRQPSRRHHDVIGQNRDYIPFTGLDPLVPCLGASQVGLIANDCDAVCRLQVLRRAVSGGIVHDDELAPLVRQAQDGLQALHGVQQLVVHGNDETDAGQRDHTDTEEESEASFPRSRPYAAISRSIMASTVKRVSTRLRPDLPIATRRVESCNRFTMACANAFGSPGGTRSPVWPSCTISGSPPVVVATTGLRMAMASSTAIPNRSEEHTSELQSRLHLVCRLLLEKKK